VKVWKQQEGKKSDKTGTVDSEDEGDYKPKKKKKKSKTDTDESNEVLGSLEQEPQQVDQSTARKNAFAYLKKKRKKHKKSKKDKKKNRKRKKRIDEGEDASGEERLKKRRKKKKDAEPDEFQELERQLMDDAKLDTEQIVNELLHADIDTEQPNDNEVQQHDKVEVHNEEDKDNSFEKQMEDIASIGDVNDKHVLQASNANFDTVS